jgi:hypothetical protein
MVYHFEYRPPIRRRFPSRLVGRDTRDQVAYYPAVRFHAFDDRCDIHRYEVSSGRTRQGRPDQYACAKMTRRVDGFPQYTHRPTSCSQLIGMHRIDALVSSLIVASQAELPHQCAWINPPRSAAV